MKDNAILLERTIEAYWGQPKSSIYFANYYGDNFEMRAILFAIVLFEINYKSDDYKSEDLNLLENFLSKTSSKQTIHNDNIQILELLANHKKNML